jgi:hypothetical protein
MEGGMSRYRPILGALAVPASTSSRLGSTRRRYGQDPERYGAQIRAARSRRPQDVPAVSHPRCPPAPRVGGYGFSNFGHS